MWDAILLTRGNSPLRISSTRVYGFHGETNKQTNKQTKQNKSVTGDVPPSTLTSDFRARVFLVQNDR